MTQDALMFTIVISKVGPKHTYTTVEGMTEWFAKVVNTPTDVITVQHYKDGREIATLRDLVLIVLDDETIIRGLVNITDAWLLGFKRDYMESTVRRSLFRTYGELPINPNAEKFGTVKK